MNDAHSTQRERVIPKWVGIKASIASGELGIPNSKPLSINDATIHAIQAEKLEFMETKSPVAALSLLESAIILDDRNLAEDISRQVKEFGMSDKPILELVDNILHSPPDLSTISSEDIQIAGLKKHLIQHPRNALAWIDIARLYATKGQREKARRAAIIAIELAPIDRYVVRSAVRYLIHLHDFEKAFDYIRKSNKLIKDPWLKATEINVALIAEKRIPAFKGYIPKVLSDSDYYHLSELHETEGLLELNAGNTRKAKKKFKTAWVLPSNNVITHGEWVLRNKLQSMKETTNLDWNKSTEALTWIQYIQMDFQSASIAAEIWAKEEPYSASPFILGVSIACAANLPHEGVKIAEKGLIANDDDVILHNNLCYALLRAGEIEKAELEIQKIEHVIRLRQPEDQYLFCLATKGLLDYKKGNIASGRAAYIAVIDAARKKKELDVLAKASLNMALAELEASRTPPMHYIESAIAVSENSNMPDIRAIRNLVMDKIKNLDKSNK